ncbi:hypothetical protein PENTCL1PPCAC_333, partial [Pristionchus entomophagus]
ESVKANSLSIAFHGEARSKFSETRSETRSQAHTNTYNDANYNLHTQTTYTYETTTHTTHFNGSTRYVNATICVWEPPSGNSIGHIPAGTNRFQFRHKLPAECRSSYEGQNGHIRYHCVASLARPGFKDNITSNKVFKVNVLADLNNIVRAYTFYSKSETMEARCLCLERGKLSVTIKYRGGFIPGEEIPVVADISNDSAQ